MAKRYTVQEIVERSTISRSGKVEKLYRVSATSESGTAFTVEIPEVEFTKEKVDKILVDKAALMDEVKKL
jgi:hypothetical protein